jgi:hypothetical protein
VVRIAQNPSVVLNAVNPEVVEKTMAKWRATNLGVQSVDAAEYTVEYDEFVKAVQKAGSVKVEGKIMVNPTEDELLMVCLYVCVSVCDGVGKQVYVSLCVCEFVFCLLVYLCAQSSFNSCNTCSDVRISSQIQNL